MNVQINRETPKNISHKQIKHRQSHINRYRFCSNQLKAVSERLSRFRMISFLAFVISVYFTNDPQGVIFALTSILSFGLFVFFVYRHKHTQTRKHRFDFHCDHYSDSIIRRQRSWHEMAHMDFAEPSAQVLWEHKDTIKDLAIVDNNASLVKLFTMVKCKEAWKKLYHWLTTPVENGEITSRQDAVKELETRPRLILDLLYQSSLFKTSSAQHERFKKWLKNEPINYSSNKQIYLLSILSLVCFWGCLIGYVFGFVTVWLLTLATLANISMLFATYGHTKKILDTTEGFRNIFESMHKRVNILEKQQFANSRLQELQRPLIDDYQSALKSLPSIKKLILMAEFRNYGLFYLFAQMLMLWDIHVCKLIANWHKTNRTHILASHQGLSEIELLAGIACFAKENDEFHYPKYISTSGDISFSALSHPLLSYAERIGNELACTKDKPMLLISGSNMSGKSTFMKSIGLNLMLGRLGAPICATNAALQDMDIKTVIKVEDSIAHGESYFMAELKRITTIINSKHHSLNTGLSLYLFDEIMSGTNSEDRIAIFKSLATKLMNDNVIMVFSTHDNKLIETMKNNPAVSFYQFYERYCKVDQQLHLNFDYKLKKGVCSQTNAQLLLRFLNTEIAE